MVEKNLKKEQAKKMRVYSTCNTGTISHKTAKYPSRNDLKANLRRILKDY